MAEESTTVLNVPKPGLQLIPPKSQVRPSPEETVSGNRYDVVLACQPDALDHFPLYSDVVDLVEDEKGLRVYSPHADILQNHDLSEIVTFTTTEAIPRTRGVLAHLTTITPDIQKMFDATYRNSRPFILFYAVDANPFNEANAENIRAHPNYRGECIYTTDAHAIELLERQLDLLIGEN